jgi:hypothetical protein
MIAQAAPAVVAAPEAFRPLRWNEMVKRGDYIQDGRNGYELWVGPSGFHAGSFVKQIYRRSSRQPVVEKPAE